MSNSAVAIDWDPSALTYNRLAGLDDMRSRCPVAFSESLGWSVFSYQDVVAVSGDVEKFSNVRLNDGVRSPIESRSIPIEMDPPEHTLYRNLLMPLFAPARMRAFEETLVNLAASDLDVLLNGDTVDVVSSFADPFPVRVICAFLGWDCDDWRQIKSMSAAVRTAMQLRDEALMSAAHGAWRDYIRAALEARQAAPRNDATSWLLAQRVAGRPLSEDELIRIIRLLLVAGHGTTTASFGKMIGYLGANPARQQQLRDSPGLVPSAIEEMLRWSGPLIASMRTATQDVEIGDRKIQAGQKVSLIYMAANRDPDVFRQPEVCDFARKPRHLAFGAGIHTCLGSPLARLELRIALTHLLQRTASFEVVGVYPDIDGRNFITDDLNTLLVKFYLT